MHSQLPSRAPEGSTAPPPAWCDEMLKARLGHLVSYTAAIAQMSQQQVQNKYLGNGNHLLCLQLQASGLIYWQLESLGEPASHG